MTINGDIDGSFFCLVYSFNNDSDLEFGIDKLIGLTCLLIPRLFN